jgi:uncharacterized protein (TIGR00297 family)
MPSLKKSDLVAIVLAGPLLIVFSLPASGQQPYWIAAAVSLIFSLLAWALRGVDTGGAFVGAVIAFAFYRYGGWRLFAALFFVFVLTYASTKCAGKPREPKGRGGAQVCANLLLPALVILFPGADACVYTIVIASLAELAGDTVSSEIGTAYGGIPVLLTTLRKTEPGGNGGVTLLGSAAGILAAMATTGFAWLIGLHRSESWIPPLAAIAGMFADSLLGATLENRGWLNNDAVNLLGTSTAALAALAICAVRLAMH